MYFSIQQLKCAEILRLEKELAEKSPKDRPAVIRELLDRGITFQQIEEYLDLLENCLNERKPAS